jgi:hypothetical protein
MRRLLRILKFTSLALLALLSVGLIWFGISKWRANARFVAKLQELRDQQLPTSLADLKLTPPPPEKNAVTYLRRAQGEATAIAREVESACKAAGDTDEDSSHYEAVWAGRLTPTMQQGIRDALANHPTAIPLLLQACNSPEYDWHYDYDAGTQYNGRETSFLDQCLDSDSVGYKRDVFRVLYYHTLLLASEGKTEESLQTCRAMLRLAKFFAQDPMLVNYLVADAVYSIVTFNAINQVLRSGPLTPETHAALDAALADLDLEHQFRQAMMSERAYSVQCFQEMSEVWKVILLTRFDDRLVYLSLFDQVAKDSNRPFDAKLRSELAAMGATGGVFSNLILPALENGRESLARTQAKQRILRVLNLLVQRDPTGKNGLTIEQLGLPVEATVDPFDGKPLRIKHTGAGWLVYSVGKNLQDDGGKLDDDRTDVGVGPIELAPSR